MHIMNALTALVLVCFKGGYNSDVLRTSSARSAIYTIVSMMNKTDLMYCIILSHHQGVKTCKIKKKSALFSCSLTAFLSQAT